MAKIITNKLNDLFVYLLSIALALVVPLTTLFAVLQLELIHPYPSVLIAIVSAATAAFLGALAPRWSLRLGLIASSGWWIYFGLVFIASLRRDHIAWMAALEGIGIAMLASMSAVFAGAIASMRSRLRQQRSTLARPPV